MASVVTYPRSALKAFFAILSNPVLGRAAAMSGPKCIMAVWT